MTSTVYVNGRFLAQRLSGVQRYAYEVLTELDRVLSERKLSWRLVVLAPRDAVLPEVWSNLDVRRVGQLTGHPWEQIELPFFAKGGLLVNLIGSAPLLRSNQIVTFHDAAVFDEPQLFSWQYGLLYRMLRPLLARRARAIVTVSEFSRGRLAEKLGVSDALFSVIGNGCDHILRPVADAGVLDRVGLQAGRYVLCVGATPNKNLAASLAAFKRAGLLGYRCAVAGAAPASVFGQVPAQFEDASLASLGHVTDEELRALYENAALFAFPSHYEGFGIPPLEAMILGCPAVANSVCAMPEVLGDAAVLVDAGNTEAFASAMRKCVQPEQREHLVEIGRIRAASFTWRVAAEKWAALIDVYTAGTPANSRGAAI